MSLRPYHLVDDDSPTPIVTSDDEFRRFRYLDNDCFVLLLEWMSGQGFEAAWVELWAPGERRLGFITKDGASSGSLPLGRVLTLAGALEGEDVT